MDISKFTRQVLYNCTVSDARYAGLYSICGLAMRLRDLYKWERRLPPWQEDEAARVLEWIGAKEDLWETLLETDFSPLPVNGRGFEPFDTKDINAALGPLNLFYGAGYAYSLKPTFFLAEITRQETVAGHRVRYLGRELARDLLTLPAFSQDGEVVLRSEATRMFLWDQIAYISNSGRGALDFAAVSMGLPDTRTQTIRDHFGAILEVQQKICLWHEIGELEECVFDRSVWQQILADFPHTAVEFLCRTLKDLLADTGPQGALIHLIQNRDAAALGLYMAFGNGITRLLTPELIYAFDAFRTDPQWCRMMAAAQAVREMTMTHTGRLLEIYHQGMRRRNPEGVRQAIEDYMREQGWMPGNRIQEICH